MSKLAKYTTQQLKDAAIGLHKIAHDSKANLIAFQLAFDELNKRLGDIEFDKWCDEVGI